MVGQIHKTVFLVARAVATYLVGKSQPLISYSGFLRQCLHCGWACFQTGVRALGAASLARFDMSSHVSCLRLYEERQNPWRTCESRHAAFSLIRGTRPTIYMGVGSTEVSFSLIGQLVSCREPARLGSCLAPKYSAQGSWESIAAREACRISLFPV